MTTLLLCASLVSAAIAALVTGIVLRLSVAHGLLDLPNDRSSHTVPTPRGGGLAIVIAVSGTLGLLRVLRGSTWLPHGVLWSLMGGGLAVALVGFVDDRRPVSATVRLGVHVAAALWALWCLDGLPALALGTQVVRLGWVGQGLVLLGIVWSLNLFNFMDGIDGIAASEAVFVAAAGAVMALTIGATSALVAVELIVAAACGGFLMWNWPPARIFMGDVGSGYTGYVLAVLAVAATRENPAAAWVWLILYGAFFVDATVTLARRWLRGEAVHEAHRSHAYQRLARKWHSHRRVTLALTAVNACWLLPCALLATIFTPLAPWCLLFALAPLVIVANRAGAGLPDVLSI